MYYKVRVLICKIIIIIIKNQRICENKFNSDLDSWKRKQKLIKKQIKKK